MAYINQHGEPAGQNLSNRGPINLGELRKTPLTDADRLQRRQRAQEKRIRSRRLRAVGTLGPVALIAAVVAYPKVNEAIDRADGVSESQLTQLANVKPSSNVKFVKFMFKGEGENSLSSAINQYAPKEDLTKATTDIATYLPTKEQQESKTVYPGEEIEFAVNTETHEIVPKDQAPPLPSAEQGQ